MLYFEEGGVVLYRLSLTDLHLILLNTLPGCPNNRAYHTSVYHNDRVFILGGAYEDTFGDWFFYNGTTLIIFPFLHVLQYVIYMTYILQIYMLMT